MKSELNQIIITCFYMTHLSPSIYTSRPVFAHIIHVSYFLKKTQIKLTKIARSVKLNLEKT